MIRAFFISAVVLAALNGGAAPESASTPVFESPGRPSPENQIDRFIFSKLADSGIKPVLCSDAVFVRRVYLDVIGKLPTAAEAAQFINNPDTQTKRAALIDQLLNRDEFADYWSMLWGDTLRIKAEFPVNLWPDAAQAYHRWVRASIAENKPYDRFVREMLTSSGSNFRTGPVNFYRAIQNKTPEGIAAVVALTFMGARAEAWPKERQDGMKVFFEQVGYKPTSEWKEEIVFWDPLKASSTAGNSAPGRDSITTAAASNSVATNAAAVTGPQKAVFQDGKAVLLTGDRDPREIFADWLIRPDNPWFARCAVNRTWAWLLGRGLIHEPDDIRKDNPPSHPELLSWLEKELVQNKYDMKHLIRLILNSGTYQFSSVAQNDHPAAEKLFAVYPVRRLDAEVLIDAINSVTGTSELYTSAIPEPFTYLPKDQPAVAIADGSITSPFLALFGRSARATGMANERDNQTIAAQSRHLLNSSHIQSKIETGPRFKQLFDPKKPARKIVDDLYLTVLSRYPTDQEVETVMTYGDFQKKPAAGQPVKTGSGDNAEPQTKVKRNPKQDPVGASAERSKWNDIAWSLINSPEFLYKH